MRRDLLEQRRPLVNEDGERVPGGTEAAEYMI